MEERGTLILLRDEWPDFLELPSTQESHRNKQELQVVRAFEKESDHSCLTILNILGPFRVVNDHLNNSMTKLKKKMVYR